jgi:uncharacterized protein
MDITKSIKKLEDWFSEIDASITAFSGGVDSALVLYLSKKFLGDNAIAIMGVSPSLKNRDKQIGIDFCKEHNIQLGFINTDELENENYALNPVDRCYHCKNTMYQHIREIAHEFPNHTILNGTNADDLGDYRPGLVAAEENFIRSPLSECNIGKEELRLIAKEFGLEVWNKPASPCLSSRIPYGESITFEKLNRIEAAEDLLMRLGFEDCRVRHYQNHASIEVPEASLARLIELGDQALEEIKKLGFNKVTIDTEGLVSGKLNRVLSNEQKA